MEIQQYNADRANLMSYLTAAGYPLRGVISQYERFLQETQVSPLIPDLDAFRDWLTFTQGVSDKTVQSYVSALRRKYLDLTTSNHFRNFLADRAQNREQGTANQAAWVNELITRIQNALASDKGVVKLSYTVEKSDDERIWLTKDQAEDLMKAPGVSTKRGLRDTALISLALATGARANELRLLEVEHLQKYVNGVLCMRVFGKGSKIRHIPYGEMKGVLNIVERWLGSAGIHEGYVFRGFTKGYHIRQTSMGESTFRTSILPKYRTKDGTKVNPHALRRTFARRCFEAGMTIETIRDLMGHSSTQMAEHYVGATDFTARQPVRLYEFPE